MITLPGMGLVKWESLNDKFSHEQLAANFQAINDHDHTSGKGVKIPYGGLADGSVGIENLKNGTVDTLIPDGSLGSRKLMPNRGEVKATEPWVPPGTSNLQTIPGMSVSLQAAVKSVARVWVSVDYPGEGNIEVVLTNKEGEEFYLLRAVESGANTLVGFTEIAVASGLETLTVKAKGNAELDGGGEASTTRMIYDLWASS